MKFLDLSSDVHIVLLVLLDVCELSALSQTCRAMHTLVGCSNLCCPHLWLTHRWQGTRVWMAHSLAITQPPVFQLVALIFIVDGCGYGTLQHVDRPCMVTRKFRCALVGQGLAFETKTTRMLHPACPSLAWLNQALQLAINSSRLVVAAGVHLSSYEFGADLSRGAPTLTLEGSCALRARTSGACDITSICFVPDGGLDRTLVIGYADGKLERVFLNSSPHQHGISVDRIQVQLRVECAVASLSSSRGHLLSFSSMGTTALLDLSDLSSPAFTQDIEPDAPGWATHLCLQASTPYAAFGTSSTTASLVLHSITDSGISPEPMCVLDCASKRTGRAPAVYDIARAPPSCPWGSSDQLLISGCYDGVVRVHDLRSVARTPSVDGTQRLSPVLAFRDPWLDEPIYAVSCGGGGASHIAAGGARHNSISFWDVRAPKRGWTVQAAGYGSSPMYDIILESSRLFGADQGRSFVLDFGPDVPSDPTHNTLRLWPPTWHMSPLPQGANTDVMGKNSLINMA
jgi:WD40 repeat protein